MILERYLWWVLLAWCVWHSWSAMKLAERSGAASPGNTAGTEILASLVQKLDGGRKFIGNEGNFRVEACDIFNVATRRFRVTIIEIEEQVDA